MRLPSSPGLLFVLLGCDATPVDADGDGFDSREDCDDDSPFVYLDRKDADGDGYTSCDGDCDDDNASVGPDQPEIPGNGIDDDCQGGEVSLEQAVVVNEIHYDPSQGEAGDANADGTRSPVEDEFVEIVNISGRPLDVSGITLWDDENLNQPSASTYGIANHRVPDGTVLPASTALVVFGGGSPTGMFGGAVVQTSTSGNLNLNNAGDELFVQDAWGEPALTVDITPLDDEPDESYLRWPELSGTDFVRHTTAVPSLYSPGTRADGIPFTSELTGTGAYWFGNQETSPFVTPVRVHYHLPASATPETPIVLVFHGANRNADEYRDAWIDKAEEHDFVILAPEFDRRFFPGSNSYNLGNLFEDGDAPSSLTERDPLQWTFSVVEPLFDHAVESLRSTQTTFHAFGHSAGAQFVHRLALFVPDGSYETLIAANAGWYTAADPETDFPYGLAITPAELAPPDWFGLDLWVHIGELDTSIGGSLRQTEEANAQGLTRYDRAYWFAERSAMLAQEAGVPLSWGLVEVPGVGHDHVAMSAFAADWLANHLANP